ncbi:MAG: hypothetical protein PHX63_07095 [Eubacteriales bacterium]|nr:hypothetical protein [Eubacteriales bacterium]
MRSRFTIILLVILAVALWGCGSEDSKPESAVEGLLSALYTVSDHSLYEKLLEGAAEIELPELSSGVSQLYSFPEEIHTDLIVLFSPYATEDCIDKLFASREALNLRQLAYEKGFTSEIDSISIRPSTAEEVDGGVSLAFDLSIKATYEKDGSESTVAISGYATVRETPPGVFLMDFLRITDRSEIGKLNEYEPYSFKGETLMNIDDRSFELEGIVTEGDKKQIWSSEETRYKKVDDLEGFTLKTSKDTYDNDVDEICYIFENNTDKEYMFGEHFQLEKWKDVVSVVAK